MNGRTQKTEQSINKDLHLIAKNVDSIIFMCFSFYILFPFILVRFFNTNLHYIFSQFFFESHIVGILLRWQTTAIFATNESNSHNNDEK